MSYQDFQSKLKRLSIFAYLYDSVFRLGYLTTTGQLYQYIDNDTFLFQLNIFNQYYQFNSFLFSYMTLHCKSCQGTVYLGAGVFHIATGFVLCIQG